MSTIRVWRCRKSYHPTNCWHARCSGCLEATAFDFTEAEARSIVANACRCDVTNPGDVK